MLITKKINNNVAMARDDRGGEFVVFGKGVGFPKTPYLLEDESVLQGVFSNMNEGILSMVRGIPDEVIDASIEIIELARKELGCELNPNAFLTLADHLQFAAERTEEGYVVENPLAGTVEYVYPKEYAIGQCGLEIIREKTGAELPDTEACSIAMHLVNSEAGEGRSTNMDEVMRILKSIDEVTTIVEHSLNICVDRSSYNYARFTTHLRYLVKRLTSADVATNPNTELYQRIATEFPEVCACADKICAYLQERYDCTCTDEEKLYLMMYINRFLANR